MANRLGLAQGVVATAMGYALPKIVGLLTPGDAVPAGVPAEVTRFLSQAPAAAATPRRVRCPADARTARRNALAVAGARRPGRGRLPVLFLVDLQPDTIGSARRKGAGALDRRPGAAPAPAAGSFASGASANPAASAGSAGACACFDGNASDASSTACACRLYGSTSDSPAGFASADGASARSGASAGGAGPCACFDGNAGDASSTAGACRLNGSTSDSAAGFASADGARPRRPSVAPGDRTGAGNLGSSNDNRPGAFNDGSRGGCNG